MPAGQPQVGEVWEMLDATGRSVRGVVSEMTETVATLVSFTGNRFRIPPHGLIASWRFSQAPPATALRCNRRGCGQPGIMRFQRGVSPEWVCARHLPVGVVAALTTESLGIPPTPQAPEQTLSRCPGCDLQVEVIEDARCSTNYVTFWQCPACNTRWGAVSIPDQYLNSNAAGDFYRSAVTGFIERAQGMGMGITQLQAVPHVIELLRRTPLAADADPMFTYLGFQMTPNLDIPPQTPIIIRVSGAPTVRETPSTVVSSSWTLLPMGRAADQGPRPTIEETAAQVARALRDDREEMRAGRISNVGAPEDIFGSFPVRSEVAVQHNYETVPGRFGTTDEESWIEAMAPTPYAAVGQRWVNRSTGDLVEVTRVQPTDDRTTQAVHFRRVADGIESSHAMVLEDFLRECRPYIHRASTPVQVPVVQVLKDEEWEHIDSGETVTIETVDTRRDLVIVVQKEGKRRSVPLYEFANAKWRRIIRRTSFDRLLDLEDD